MIEQLREWSHDAIDSEPIDRGVVDELVRAVADEPDDLVAAWSTFESLRGPKEERRDGGEHACAVVERVIEARRAARIRVAMARPVRSVLRAVRRWPPGVTPEIDALAASSIQLLHVGAVCEVHVVLPGRWALWRERVLEYVCILLRAYGTPRTTRVQVVVA